MIEKVLVTGLAAAEQDQLGRAIGDLALEACPSFEELEDPAALAEKSAAEDQLLVLRLDRDGGYPGRLDFIWALKLRGSLPRWIAVTEDPERFPGGLCHRLGACAYLPGPFDAELLALNIACLRQPEQPRPSDELQPLDYLHMAHSLAIDVVLSVRSAEGRTGVITLDRGALRHALLWDTEVAGEDALFEILSWPRSTLFVERPRGEAQKSLSLSFVEAISRFAANLESPPQPSAASLRWMARREAVAEALAGPCAAIVEELPDALACTVVDLDSGQIMASHIRPGLEEGMVDLPYLESLAATAMGWLCGPSIQRIEALLSQQRAAQVRGAFREIYARSADRSHFVVAIGERRFAVVLVSGTATSQGMGWAVLRGGLTGLEAALP